MTATGPQAGDPATGPKAGDPATGAEDGEVPAIRLRSASFGYADRAVVSGVDLDVYAGEALALLGPNGCGKSTLVKGVLRLNDHLDGSVELFGTPLARFRRRHRLGYVPQRHTLSNSVAATVSEVVAAGRLSHQGLLARMRRRDRQIVAESLDVVGLSEFAKQDVSTLSGGQQRRVLIARALAGEPDALVMDEPTAGVDVANQRLLATVLRRLRDRGVGLLIVTHDVDALEDTLDRIVYMSAGRLVFDSTPEAFAQAQASAQSWRLGGGQHHPDPEPAQAGWVGVPPGTVLGSRGPGSRRSVRHA